MVLDGRTIVEKNYVDFGDTLFETEEQIQPNGVDLRVGAVKYVTGTAHLPRDGRIQAGSIRIDDIPAKNGAFDLYHITGNYLVDFLETISVPAGFCAIVITRSSLVRVGCDVLTGLWDTGFQGRLGASIRIKNPISVEYGARMAQVMFYKAAFNGHMYAGGYQGSTQSEFK